MEVGEGYKKCSKCGEVKEHGEFNKSKFNKDGFVNTCKPCVREYNRIYHKERKEGIRSSKKKAEVGYKICNRCEEEKKLSEFHRSNKAKNGAWSYCKKCTSKLNKASREKFIKEKRCINDKYNNKKCSKCGEEKSYKSFYKDEGKKSGLNSQCKECVKEYRNRPETITRINKYRIEYRSRPETKIVERRYDRKRLEDPFHRLNENISSGIRHSLRMGSKGGRHWEKLVDYTANDLREHLEKQFTEGMSWSNYGAWEVDHVLPKSIFNFTKPEHLDFKRCWALSNLQPLWKEENNFKRAKITEHFQIGLALEMRE